MKQLTVFLLAAVLLLCFAGCDGKARESVMADWQITPDELIGTYDISFCTEGDESYVKQAKFIILDGNIAIALFPFEGGSAVAAESYNSKTGEARFAVPEKEGTGGYVTVYDMVFSEKDGAVAIEGTFTRQESEAEPQNGTLTGFMLPE